MKSLHDAGILESLFALATDVIDIKIVSVSLWLLDFIKHHGLAALLHTLFLFLPFGFDSGLRFRGKNSLCVFKHRLPCPLGLYYIWLIIDGLVLYLVADDEIDKVIFNYLVEADS